MIFLNIIPNYFSLASILYTYIYVSSTNEFICMLIKNRHFYYPNSEISIFGFRIPKLAFFGFWFRKFFEFGDSEFRKFFEFGNSGFRIQIQKFRDFKNFIRENPYDNKFFSKIRKPYELFHKNFTKNQKKT